MKERKGRGECGSTSSESDSEISDSEISEPESSSESEPSEDLHSHLSNLDKQWSQLIAQDCADNLVLAHLDSDAVWHAHEVPFEYVFYENDQVKSEFYTEDAARNLKKGGLATAPSDDMGKSSLILHSSTWIALGERGFTVLKEWRDLYFKGADVLWTKKIRGGISSSALNSDLAVNMPDWSCRKKIPDNTKTLEVVDYDDNNDYEAAKQGLMTRPNEKGLKPCWYGDILAPKTLILGT